MSNEVKKEELKNCLSNEIFVVKVVEENASTWVSKEKDGHTRLEGTRVVYDAPLTSNGIARILSAEEQAYLEYKMDKSRPAGWLSPYRSEKNVWVGKGRYKVELTADTAIEFNMNECVDFIKCKILLANDDDIAPSYEARRDREYLFYLESKSNKDKSKAEKVNSKVEAMEYFSKLMVSDEKMRGVLLVAYKGDTKIIPKGMNTNGLKTALYEFVDTRTKLFLDIVNDVEIKYKIMVYKALENGVFARRGHEFREENMSGKIIGTNLIEAIDHIRKLESDTDKQAEYIKFTNRINS